MSDENLDPHQWVDTPTPIFDETVTAYLKLFRGRGDAKGTWAGGAERCQIGYTDFHNHLNGMDPADWMGTYPHLGDRGVSWGCIDIDGKDFRLRDDADDWNWPKMLELANRLKLVLAVKDVYAHVERTRNGYHVWVFPEDGVVPAAYMRRSLMAACVACSYDPKEVNPKSEELAPGKLGNYVRLPYYGSLGPNGLYGDDRFFLDENNEPITVFQFLETVQRTSTKALEELHHLWTPKPTVELNGEIPTDLEPILPTLSGMAFTIWRDGPLEGRDRSNTLAKLSYTLHGDGVPMETAYAVVKNADERWGRFFDRADCEEQITKLIQLAY